MSSVPVRSCERAYAAAGGGGTRPEPRSGLLPRLDAADDEDTNRRSQTRVIVADDEPDARTMLGSALIRAGFDVTLVRDGKELLDLVNSLPPNWFDLVVVDHRMPRMQGLEVIARSSSRTKFVMVTAYADPTLRIAAAELGAAAVVAKPFDMQEFIDLVVELTVGDGEHTA